MLDAKALLVSRCSSTVESIEGLRNSIGYLRLEVCADLPTTAEEVQKRGVTLVLAHLPCANDDGALTRLTWNLATSDLPIAVVALGSEYDDNRARALARAGAADYLALPMDLGKLAFLLDVLTRRWRHRPPSLANLQSSQPPELLALLQEASVGMSSILDTVRRVARQEATVLLTGETGTGKTHLARLIHNLSPRRDESFLVVDCGSLSANLIESELFGHVKGSFTGADRDRAGKLAAAGSGTLLLDEINSLPLNLQAKLLRAVDDRVFEPVGANKQQPVLARLIAASSAPLEAEVEAGRFRSDLYHRLNVIGLHLPPLRERREVVGTLAQQFLRESVQRNRPDVVGLSVGALRALENYDWPGNIRELRNIVERAVALCEGPEVITNDLPEPVRRLTDAMPPAAAARTLAASKTEAEARRIQEALKRHKNNRLRAAAELGISRMGLYKKLHKYGLFEKKGQSSESGPTDHSESSSPDHASRQ
jgi:DNA-binding NtrC family response regulator